MGTLFTLFLLPSFHLTHAISSPPLSNSYIYESIWCRSYAYLLRADYSEENWFFLLSQKLVAFHQQRWSHGFSLISNDILTNGVKIVVCATSLILYWCRLPVICRRPSPRVMSVLVFWLLQSFCFLFSPVLMHLPGKAGERGSDSSFIMKN